MISGKQQRLGCSLRRLTDDGLSGPLIVRLLGCMRLILPSLSTHCNILKTYLVASTCMTTRQTPTCQPILLLLPSYYFRLDYSLLIFFCCPLLHYPLVSFLFFPLFLYAVFASIILSLSSLAPSISVMSLSFLW